LKSERVRVSTEEAQKAKSAAAAELVGKNRELVEAQKAQAELIKKQRELDDAKRELELTVEKRVQDGLTDY
jgi:hypothetical protein